MHITVCMLCHNKKKTHIGYTKKEKKRKKKKERKKERKKGRKKEKEKERKEKQFTLAGVAQWIECRPANLRVAGSIPCQDTCLGCRPGPR